MNLKNERTTMILAGLGIGIISAGLVLILPSLVQVHVCVLFL